MREKERERLDDNFKKALLISPWPLLFSATQLHEQYEKPKGYFARKIRLSGFDLGYVKSFLWIFEKIYRWTLEILAFKAFFNRYLAKIWIYCMGRIRKLYFFGFKSSKSNSYWRIITKISCSILQIPWIFNFRQIAQFYYPQSQESRLDYHLPTLQQYFAKLAKSMETRLNKLRSLTTIRN